MESLKEILMKRDGMSSEEADEEISSAREELMDIIGNGDLSEADGFMEDWFGLEPDYLFELIG